MSTWRDQLVPASFRGVGFKVEASEVTGGRRIVRHEYPFRDDQFVEDMGKKGKGFAIEAFVLGDEYIDDRDALNAALESGGSGELIHPFYGTLRVNVGDFRIRETSSDGGVARFSIEFHRTTRTPSEPDTSANSASAVLASATAARSSVLTVFNKAFGVVSTIHDGVAGTLRSLSNGINSVLEKVSIVTQTAAELQTQIQGISNDALQLASAPGDLVTAMTGLFDTLATAFSAPNISDPLSVFLGVYNQDPGLRPPATTPNRIREQANFDAVHQLIQRLAIIQAATLATGLTFTSYDAAVVARDSIAALIDDQAEAAADDSYPFLLQLRADLVNSIPGDANDLPRLLQHTPRATKPSLVLAHGLYAGHFSPFADLSAAEADLVSRNNIRNPSFVPGGEPLEILSSDS